ncbi:MAG: hypothetical protein RJB01_1050 [Actinomycetota bacterium]|jgi:hypothetical protein
MSRSIDSERRKFRFAIFLQSFALVMFLGAGFVRGLAIGWDALSWVFIGAGLMAGVLVAVTVTMYRNTLE